MLYNGIYIRNPSQSTDIIDNLLKLWTSTHVNHNLLERQKIRAKTLTVILNSAHCQHPKSSRNARGCLTSLLGRFRKFLTNSLVGQRQTKKTKDAPLLSSIKSNTLLPRFLLACPELWASTLHLALTNTKALPRECHYCHYCLQQAGAKRRQRGEHCSIALTRTLTTKKCYRSWTFAVRDRESN